MKIAVLVNMWRKRVLMYNNEDVCKKIRENQKKRQKKERLIHICIAAVFLIILAAVIILGVFILLGNKNSDKKNKDVHSKGQIEKTTVEEETETQEPETEELMFESVKYPKVSKDYKEIDSPNVLSPYVALIDLNNNSVIAGKSYDARIFPASMTKVMTLIIAVENIENLDDTFSMTAEIIDPLVRESASRAGFEPGEIVTAKDMLYGLILPSGADASVGLATMVSGSEQNFVNLMNEKCAEIGLKNTHFTNTSGLYNEQHYTTPVEMAMIMEYAMSNDVCREVLSTYQYTTSATPQHPEGLLLSSTMFSRMYGNEVNTVNIKAGKTGYTTEAGNCLVSYAERGNDRYIAVTSGAANRWNVVFDDFEVYGNYIPNAPGYIKDGTVNNTDDVNIE